MFSRMRILLCLLSAILILAGHPNAYGEDAATTTNGEDPKLGKAGELMKKHIEKVLNELPGFEKYGKSVAERGRKDADAGEMFDHIAPREHPWKESGNPNSKFDYFLDSFLAMDASFLNFLNWKQDWSCFEPKLLAKASGMEWVNPKTFNPTNADLIAECRLKCPWYEPKGVPFPRAIPWERGTLLGIIWYKVFNGCWVDPDLWGYFEGDAPVPPDSGPNHGNGYEIAEYWFPENQADINNYGINRIKPEELSEETGKKFTREELLKQKTETPDEEIKKGLDESYPFEGKIFDAKLLEPREDPFLGQGGWLGYAAPDSEDKNFAHVYRTWLSKTMGDKRKETMAGWKVNPEFSFYDAMPPKTDEKDPVNIWTEYGMFEMITSIPQFSYKVRKDVMEALFGKKRTYIEAAKEDPPFWQKQGSAAYRVHRWPDLFKPLKDNFEIEEDDNEVLKEVVYKGGHELFPLVTSLGGFASPTLSSAAIIARRAFYLAGAKKPKDEHGDEEAGIVDYLPEKEKNRMATYTINKLNKELEIDKMMLIFPKRPKDGEQSGGVPPIIAECVKSQKVGNVTNEDEGHQTWVDENMPRKLVGYYDDSDFMSKQGGSINYIYFNRRIGCFCDRCGIPYGSTSINNGGDGDKLYDKPRMEYCRYPLRKAWNAWAKMDRFPDCEKNQKIEQYNGTGIHDER